MNLVLLKGAGLTTLDTDGLFIYRAGTTQALAVQASATLPPASGPPPWPGETTSRVDGGEQFPRSIQSLTSLLRWTSRGSCMWMDAFHLGMGL